MRYKESQIIADIYMKSYCNYWGKADQNKKCWHPLVCHMLDAAAVSRVLIEKLPNFLQEWSQRLRITHIQLLDMVSFFTSIHDLGKLSSDFQCKIPELSNRLQGISQPKISGGPHTAAAWLLWNAACEDNLFRRYDIPDSQYIDLSHTLEPLLSASFGHHGGPVREPNMVSKATFRKMFDAERVSAGLSMIEDFSELFNGFDQLLQQPGNLIVKRKELSAFSFLLSGIIILADWTSSDSINFDYVIHDEDRLSDVNVIGGSIDCYFAKAQSLAGAALERQGLNPVPNKRLENPWKELFPFLYDAGFEPSPLQKAVLAFEIQKEPGLYIIEDAAGSGKTEAALILFSKLMNNEAEGFYVGLPTMATSNGMYNRLTELYRKFYIDGPAPSLILAHGGSGLHQEYQKSIVPDMSNLSEDYDEDKNLDREETAVDYVTSKSACSEWIADRSRKVFLAQAGVGSIDQAMLSVIYSKHNTLRMLGLSRKILIIDEVHAYDIYMQKILHNLLQFQASQHRSVILLSATLPSLMKKELSDAYRRGFDLPESQGTKEIGYKNCFPLMTVSYKAKCIHLPIEAREDNKRSISLSFFTEKNISEPINYLISIHNAGKCGVWIRNTVGDVQTAYDAVVEKIGQEHVLLFHSRFAMKDRQVIENRVLDIFGKTSSSISRKGMILIASQVVEQSLDLDFDEMITDLCPIDLVIQRSGRLMRHSREKSGNISKSKDERGSPVLYIYGPNPRGDIEEIWYKDFFPGGSYVYNDPSIIWKTAKVLFEEQEIVIPEKSRFLVEQVYGESDFSIPESLRRKTGRATANDNKKKAMAELNLFPLFDGFLKPDDATPWPDSTAPTRLSGDTETYRLCLLKKNTIVPISNDRSHPWQLSEIKLRKLNMQYDTDTIRLIKEAEVKLFDKGRGGVLLPFVEENFDPLQNKILKSVGVAESGKTLLYDDKLGLRMTSL